MQLSIFMYESPNLINFNMLASFLYKTPDTRQQIPGGVSFKYLYEGIHYEAIVKYDSSTLLPIFEDSYFIKNGFRWTNKREILEHYGHIFYDKGLLEYIAGRGKSNIQKLDTESDSQNDRIGIFFDKNGCTDLEIRLHFSDMCGTHPHNKRFLKIYLDHKVTKLTLDGYFNASINFTDLPNLRYLHVEESNRLNMCNICHIDTLSLGYIPREIDLPMSINNLIISCGNTCVITNYVLHDEIFNLELKMSHVYVDYVPSKLHTLVISEHIIGYVAKIICPINKIKNLSIKSKEIMINSIPENIHSLKLESKNNVTVGNKYITQIFSSISDLKLFEYMYKPKKALRKFDKSLGPLAPILNTKIFYFNYKYFSDLPYDLDNMEHFDNLEKACFPVCPTHCIFPTSLQKLIVDNFILDDARDFMPNFTSLTKLKHLEFSIKNAVFESGLFPDSLEYLKIDYEEHQLKESNFMPPNLVTFVTKKYHPFNLPPSLETYYIDEFNVLNFKRDVIAYAEIDETEMYIKDSSINTKVINVIPVYTIGSILPKLSNTEPTTIKNICGNFTTFDISNIKSHRVEFDGKDCFTFYPLV